MRDFAKGFYNTEPWLSVRKAFIASRIGIDGGLCQECRDELGYIVHHRIELTPQNINNMGRGKGTHRIHFHMVSDGIPEETIRKKWKNGDVLRIEHLRESCTYQGKNIGQDYTGLANYLYDHWTEEQGGQRYKYSRKTCIQPEEEPATECAREYSPERPPIAPKGYEFVSTEYNKYGYMCFHYVRRRDRRKLKS